MATKVKKKNATMPNVHFAFWGKRRDAALLNRRYKEFSNRFKTNRASYRKIVELRGWSATVICPYCKVSHPIANLANPPSNWRCNGKEKCHEPFTVFTKTRLGGLHLEPKKLMALCYLVANHPKPSRTKAQKLAGMKSNKNVDRILKILKAGLSEEIKGLAVSLSLRNAKAPRLAAEALLQNGLHVD